ncbi:MAG: dinitrogenase iron-molybdenum cofactor biosynthesis protein [Zetaproteobacteria bacterium CG12_big_fil_rev_8_21_14_0_65_54_13]|nr:MAG: dinitrogenase iron-molybdenum cofactor biosynthesis protein [Zetaproteobacteria bacterium CG12_big_fil_rev_8_21_14_0_65_54_13]PIX54714.1 MAG: dinitrogenase iron-molybdenum cofactor biosynthesis protein [Zetaproteobacteria bacterium CG_4_10_14_3_um_filter_54_28]PJA28407.1 MAG: dinitrogenase iron-molybdenum cofactor biosynthesis protein [Zetaproteobacteria bacterium CG_4_9_14_3_um_filter_54_145]
MSKAQLKLAVASKDGISINAHFGHAKAFHIYSVSEDQCLLLELRQVEHYCHGHHGSQSAMAMILQTIRDCHAVFVAKIGDGPADKLAAIGVDAVADYAYEAIEPSLLDYMHQWPRPTDQQQ